MSQEVDNFVSGTLHMDIHYLSVRQHMWNTLQKEMCSLLIFLQIGDEVARLDISANRNITIWRCPLAFTFTTSLTGKGQLNFPGIVDPVGTLRLPLHSDNSKTDQDMVTWLTTKKCDLFAGQTKPAVHEWHVPHGDQRSQDMQMRFLHRQHQLYRFGLWATSPSKTYLTSQWSGGAKFRLQSLSYKIIRSECTELKRSQLAALLTSEKRSVSWEKYKELFFPCTLMSYFVFIWDWCLPISPFQMVLNTK